jgi:hypothetical protein
VESAERLVRSPCDDDHPGMVDRERLAVPPVAADILEPGLLEPTAQLRERKHADRKVESSRPSVTDDDPLAPGEAGEGVVRVRVEHEVAVRAPGRTARGSAP